MRCLFLINTKKIKDVGLRDKINMLQLRVLSKLLLSEIEMERELVLCQSER